ncbi:MAG: helix-turn-helix transcriptional regulator [Betaproteobacteria bacterium]|nr:helix-turn-helix transcriptional regulator [Betaproteobacteria bacterium]
MTKPINRPYSQYSLHALALFGQLVREGRLARGLSTTDLSTRAGISRSLLQRIEAGDPGCSIGAVFEVAAICGVPLFEPDERSLAMRVGQQREKLALLPKMVRKTKKVVKDDF